jgi:hypothetical protein
LVDAWPKLVLSLVTINLLSEPLLRPGLAWPAWRQVFQFCKCMDSTIVQLVKMMKQVKMIKLLIMRSVSGSLENISQSQATK